MKASVICSIARYFPKQWCVPSPNIRSGSTDFPSAPTRSGQKRRGDGIARLSRIADIVDTSNSEPADNFLVFPSMSITASCSLRRHMPGEIAGLNRPASSNILVNWLRPASPSLAATTALCIASGRFSNSSSILPAAKVFVGTNPVTTPNSIARISESLIGSVANWSRCNATNRSSSVSAASTVIVFAKGLRFARTIASSSNWHNLADPLSATGRIFGSPYGSPNS